MNPYFENAQRRVCGATIGLIALVATGAAAAVTENAEPLAWANTYSKGSVVVSNVVGAPARVAVHFPWSDPAWPPPRGTIYLVSGGDPQVSPFSGDYAAAGMKHIAFKLSANTNVSLVNAVLRSPSSNTEWKHPVQVPQTPNEWAVKTVPLEWELVPELSVRRKRRGVEPGSTIGELRGIAHRAQRVCQPDRNG
jgi:hypothetical protein